MGAELIHETGEPHAQPSEHRRNCVQKLTHTFALERRPQGELHVIAKPAMLSTSANRSLTASPLRFMAVKSMEKKAGPFRILIFEQLTGTKGSLWTYRKIH